MQKLCYLQNYILVMAQLVHLQMILLIASIWTQVTLIWFFTSMGAHMLFQRTISGICVWAETTFVGFQPTMRKLMAFQISAVWAGVVAFGTLVRPFTSMASLVSYEVAEFDASVWALIA